MKNKCTHGMKKVISGLLAIVTLVGVFTPTNTAYAASKYTTHSPLLSGDTMAVDEINPWELTCFGIFMSNFCVPFVDSYDTAFSKNSIGSNGAGLGALQFATGGDITSDSVVRRMLNYVTENYTGVYKQLIVKNYAINNSVTGCDTPMLDLLSDANKNTMSEYRPAVLADLLPIVSGVFCNRSTLADSPDFDYNKNYADVWSHAWVAGTTDTSAVENKSLQNLTITQGVLGDFFIYNGGETYKPSYDLPVFSMRNGWDAQIPSQCLLYSIYKFQNEPANLEIINDILNNADTLNLYMDLLGNICTLYDSRLVIIIPATLNQHITNNNLVNLVNSVVLNTLCQATQKDTIARGTSGVRAVNTDKNSGFLGAAGTDSSQVYNGLDATMINAGIGQTIHKGDAVAGGTSFLYNLATDYMSASTRYTNGLAQAEFKSFVDSGFDIHNSLRWSTVIEQKASSSNGLDLQDYIAVSEKDDKNIYFFAADNSVYSVQFGSNYTTEPSYGFTFANQWKRVIKSTGLNTDSPTYDKLAASASVFQTAAQLYMTNVGTNIETIQLYYKQLHSSTTNNTTTLLDGFDDKNAKALLVYTPIGTDYSGMSNAGLSWGDETNSAKMLQYTKSLAYRVLDMYHGRYIYEDKKGQQDLANALVSNATRGLDFTDMTQTNISDGKDTIKATSITDLLLNIESDATKDLFNDVLGIKVFKDDSFEFTDSAENADVDTLFVDKRATVSMNTGRYSWKLINQWARICPANPTLSTAASYLGLRDGLDFSLFASDMYYTYLDIYGFIADKHIFNAELYNALGNKSQSIDSKQMSEALMLQGLTAEQKEQVLKENAYLMLSTDNDGREYRSRMVSGMIEEWLIDNYDKTCYGDTESEYFQTLTSTSKSFVNLPTYAENWLTEWIVNKWNTVLPIIMLFLFVLVVIFGTLNGKKLSWILANLLLTACMLVVLPASAEITPYLVEKVSDTAFKDVIGTMAISEAVEDDTIMADIEAQYEGYSDNIKSAVKSLSALGTSGSLMLKQDMTRKVIPAQTSSVYSELKGLASARWLLPNLLAMTGADADDNAYDYVYRAVSEKRTELRQMKYALNPTVDNSIKTHISTILADTQWALDNTSPLFSITSDRSRTESNILSTAHLSELFLYKTNDIATGSSTITATKNGFIHDITQYDGTNYKPAIGYAQGTETIMPYFYLVAKDLLINNTQCQDFNALSTSDYYNLFKQNSNTSNSITLLNGNTIDFLDLEYLLSVYVPYLYTMQENAKIEFGDEQLLNLYETYENEPIAFLYECNWADKLLTAYDFGDDIIPSTYLDRYNRDMIFSRAQLVDSDIDIDDLTEVELRCIEINDEVDKQWTLLINYIATDGVTVDILAEQMALTATIAFNSIMSKDRVINSNYALYPSTVSLRTINFDTMMKLVLMSNFGLADTNQNSMRIVLAESGLLMGFVLWILALLVTHVVPFVTGLSMAVVFYASIFSCVYNAAVDGKDKLKTCGGAAVTCLAIAVETCAYVYSYALIIGNTNKMLSVDKIAAGTTVATGKVLAILLITIAYLILLIFQAWKNAVNFRDMGAQMWMSYSKKSYEAVTTFFKNFASKVKGAIKHTDPTAAAMKDAMDGVEVQAKLDDEVKVKNTAADPLFTKDANSSSEATYIWGSEDESDNSGYILNPHHRDTTVQADDKSSGSTTKTESSDESKDA